MYEYFEYERVQYVCRYMYIYIYIWTVERSDKTCLNKLSTQMDENLKDFAPQVDEFL